MAEHYRTIGLEHGWKWEQVTRLCRLIGKTEHELAAMYHISGAMMAHWRRSDHVPTVAAIHFRILQDWWNERHLGTQPMVIIPVDKMVL